jgi:uncharacterized protein (TIGR02217 family)
MSTQVFPSLPGLAWPVKRSELWKTRAPEAISGKETRIADWSYPRHEWTLGFDLLRQGTRTAGIFTELAQLDGFFNERQGQFDSFLYTDPDDCSVTAQAIGTGDGSTTSFQLVRAFGGFVEPIFAPNVVSHIYVNGVDPGGWTVSYWGSATPGIVTFGAAPAAQPITADFTYYFPCRFSADQMDFAKFMATLWSAKAVKFRSIK